MSLTPLLPPPDAARPPTLNGEGLGALHDILAGRVPLAWVRAVYLHDHEWPAAARLLEDRPFFRRALENRKLVQRMPANGLPAACRTAWLQHSTRA